MSGKVFQGSTDTVTTCQPISISVGNHLPVGVLGGWMGSFCTVMFFWMVSWSQDGLYWVKWYQYKSDMIIEYVNDRLIQYSLIIMNSRNDTQSSVTSS